MAKYNILQDKSFAFAVCKILAKIKITTTTS